MKLNLPCTLCAALTQEDSIDEIQLVETELRDDGAYLCHCAKGHPFTVFLQQQHFEMLFELGLNAAIDGYYREAVSNFAASLERFYEFSLHIFMLANAVSQDQWLGVWNKVKNASERQIGAYAFMHLAMLHEPAKLLNDKQVSFRNSVVHKGTIPTLAAALEFGEVVRAIILKGSAEFNWNFSDEMRAAKMHRRVIPEGALPGMVVSYFFYPTVLAFDFLERNDKDSLSLLEIVEQRKKRRKS